MNNDPNSYRVPILHLTDVLPVENPPADASKTPAPSATPAPTPTPNPTPVELKDEAQKLHEAFIAKTQAEILKKKSEKPVEEKAVPKPPVKKKTVPQKPIPHTEESLPEEVPIHVAPTLPNKKAYEEFSEDQQEEMVYEVPIPVKEVVEEPEEMVEEVEEAPEATVEEMPIEEVEELPEKPEVTAEEKPQAPVEKKTGGESILERFVTIAAEKLDPLPTRPPVKEFETQEEIATIFDSYLKTNEPKEEVPDEVVITETNITPFAPDPLDIWEQDALKPKKSFTKKLTPTPTSPNSTPIKNESQATVQEEPEPIRFVSQDLISESISTPTPLEQPVPMKIETPGAFGTLQPLQRIPSPTKKNPEVVQKTPKQEKLTKDEWVSKKAQAVQRAAHTPEGDTAQESALVEPVVEKPVPEAGVSNLSALRNRIAKEQGADTTSSEGKVDTYALDSEHETLNTAVSHKIEVIDATVPTPPPSERARPQSKHAQILSSVADRLRLMSIQSNDKQPDIQGIIAEESKALQAQAEGASAVKQGPLAPGEIREPVPVPPPNSSISPIRTFRQDVEDAVTKNKTSIVNMISTEENSRSALATVRTVPRKMSSTLSYVFIGASLVLVIGALGIGAFAFLGYMTSDTSENTEVLSTINATVPFVITDKSREDILGGLATLKNGTHRSLGSIIEIELFESVIGPVSGSDDVLTSRAKPPTFLEKVGTNVPGGLARSITDTSILGIHEMTTNQAFLLFTVEHGDVAFRSMFEWEEYMDQDLAPLFGPALERKQVNLVQPTLTQTASTTEDPYQARPAPVYEKVAYEDMFIQNKEVRGLRNSKGELVLLWSMPDDTTVLITSNEVTMKVILEQLAVQAHTK